MKTWYLILIMSLVASITFSQTDLSFPDSNAVWILGIQHSDGPGHIDYSVIQYSYGSDTTINQYVYHSVISGINQNGSYTCALRKDSAERIFIVPKDSVTEYLLYDFSVEEDDTLKVWSAGHTSPGVNSVIVKQIDSIQQGVIYFKQYQVEDISGIGGTYWIKGVGSIDGLIEPLYLPSVSYRTFLQCFTVNSQPVYPLPNPNCFGVTVEELPASSSELSLYPNPASAELTIHSAFCYFGSVLRIRDMDSNIIYHQEMNDQKITIDIGSITDGIYFVELINDKEVYRAKFIKLH